MQDAGTDVEKIMETGGLGSIWEVWDVFWGVAISVGKAEEACRFEHRDLHLGNICVRSSRSGGDVLSPSIKDPLRRKLRFTGLETTVIDYTLSRADILASSSCRSSAISNISNSTTGDEEVKEVVDVAYLDLNKDPALFEGDASEEYQYEIYRYMRGAALFNNPLQSEPEPSPESEPEQKVPVTPRRSPKKNTHIRFDSGSDEEVVLRRSPRKHAKPALDVVEMKAKPETEVNIWRHFHPRTNLVWLHFLLHKLLAHLQYHGATPDKLSLKQVMQTVCKAEEIKGEEAKVKRKAVKLYKVLQRVSELLCPVALGREEGLGCVKDLVVLALEERWVRVGDVAG
jgi:serine/threonine-protein kinase haspin